MRLSKIWEEKNSSTGTGGKHGELNLDVDTYTGMGKNDDRVLTWIHSIIFLCVFCNHLSYNAIIVGALVFLNGFYCT